MLQTTPQNSFGNKTNNINASVTIIRTKKADIQISFCTFAAFFEIYAFLLFDKRLKTTKKYSQKCLLYRK